MVEAWLRSLRVDRVEGDVEEGLPFSERVSESWLLVQERRHMAAAGTVS
jgi:hypothetical protein